MKTARQLKTVWLVAALVFTLSATSRAALITNGGFEAGLTGWTTADQVASDGTFSVQTGTSSPVNAFAVPAPPEGVNAAMTDSQGPGSHVLYQDFTVPTGIASGSVGFSLFLNNGAGAFFNPGNLDFAATNAQGSLNFNQQARVDIMTASGDPFAVTVLLNLFQTNPGDPLVSGYVPFLIDITALLQAHPGESLRLRFAETDNVSFFNLGVDNVTLVLATPIPEPSSLSMVLGAMVGLGWLLRRRSSFRLRGAL